MMLDQWADKIEPDLNTGCHLWAGGAFSKGYGAIQLDGKPVGAHRVIYCEANGLSLPEIAGWVVRHKCDTPACVNPDHLLIGTHQDNEDDKVARGRTPNGSANGNSKLTEAQVSTIRQRYRPHSKQHGALALAREFDVSVSLVGQIVNRTIWKHI